MPHISPYNINANILSLIDTLEKDFSTKTEKDILSKLNLIDSYPDMSRYQLSLTKKKLADCYNQHGITGNALALYQSALSDNKSLPVKRTIKSLQAISCADLVYSIDVNYMDEKDIIQHKQNSFSNEYDSEYEQQLHEALGRLGNDYQQEFYRLRDIHDFYSSLPDDAPPPTKPAIKRDLSRFSELTGMTEDEIFNMRQKYIDEVNQEYEANWDKITAKSMVSSKRAQNIHEKALEVARNLDHNYITSAPANISDASFSDSELLFIKYIHHKSVLLDYVPGYFTHEYHIDYCNVIQRALGSGLLWYAPPAFTLSKMTVPKLKAFLLKNEQVPSGKKSNLINQILSFGNVKCFERKYYELTSFGIEQTGYVDLYHKEEK
uniref:ATP-dependent DNA helicase n=1 Tax=Siphoviridae sp. ct2QJ10 TaxID=2825315 RepID=A0A8S5PA31_9CAUD|nr:MAG TPA: ATP-dependent DNA helicase [Siphoviridae sp. ct2QJ10]